MICMHFIGNLSNEVGVGDVLDLGGTLTFGYAPRTKTKRPLIKQPSILCNLVLLLSILTILQVNVVSYF